VKKACGVKKAQRAVQVRAIKGLAENQKSEGAGGNSGRWYF
jgi:hypothetical protein